MGLGLDSPASSRLIGLSSAPVLKKVKHRLVENMSSGTADALGLSRAILCNGKSSFHPLAQLPSSNGPDSVHALSVDSQVTPLYPWDLCQLPKSYYSCQLWALGHHQGVEGNTDLGGQVLPSSWGAWPA